MMEKSLERKVTDSAWQSQFLAPPNYAEPAQRRDTDHGESVTARALIREEASDA